MSRWGRRDDEQEDTETAFANFALTFAKAMIVLAIMLFVMITDATKKEEGIKPKAEAVIMVEWSTTDNDASGKVDVDTWVKNPSGRLVYFGNREADNTFLDRDDLGTNCKISCYEITTFRALDDGEYILNLNVYNAHDQKGNNIGPGIKLLKPLPVHIKIIKLNPTVVTQFDTTVILDTMKQEKFVVRFSILNNVMAGFDTDTPVMIMPRAGVSSSSNVAGRPH